MGVRKIGMVCGGRVRRGLRIPFFAVVLLLLGFAGAEAAYRLTFQNGTRIEVRSYDDLGDAIRYPRSGGVVTVPKSSLSSIQEVPSAPSNLPPPAAIPQVPPPPIPLSPNPSQRSVESSPTAEVRSGPPAAKPQPPAPVDLTAGARGIIGPFSLFLLMLFIVLLGLAFLTQFLPMLLGGGEKESALPYERVPSLLTAAERSFYGVLREAVDHQCTIFAKVRLGDLLEIPWGTSKFRTHLSRIDRKHVDFVLCDPASFSPLLVIELDDSSHARLDRQERDAFVDAALDAAGLAILHVPAQRAYTPADLRLQIYGRLDASLHETAKI